MAGGGSTGGVTGSGRAALGVTFFFGAAFFLGATFFFGATFFLGAAFFVVFFGAASNNGVAKPSRVSSSNPLMDSSSENSGIEQVRARAVPHTIGFDSSAKQDD
jgi:hypothetical protein